MILMIKNFGSKPKIICKRRTEAVIITGFLYLNKKCFIKSATSGFRAASGFLLG